MQNSQTNGSNSKNDPAYAFDVVLGRIRNLAPLGKEKQVMRRFNLNGVISWYRKFVEVPDHFDPKCPFRVYNPKNNQDYDEYQPDGKVYKYTKPVGEWTFTPAIPAFTENVVWNELSVGAEVYHSPCFAGVLTTLISGATRTYVVWNLDKFRINDIRKAYHQAVVNFISFNGLLRRIDEDGFPCFFLNGEAAEDLTPPIITKAEAEFLDPQKLDCLLSPSCMRSHLIRKVGEVKSPETQIQSSLDDDNIPF